MTKEMYAAEVKNWLMDLATGIKASKRSVQFLPSKSGCEWNVIAACYEKFEDGCGIHKLKELAEAIDVEPKFHKFKKGEFISDMYAGYWYIEVFGVRFYDLSYNLSEEDGSDERE